MSDVAKIASETTEKLIGLADSSLEDAISKKGRVQS